VKLGKLYGCIAKNGFKVTGLTFDDISTQSDLIKNNNLCLGFIIRRCDVGRSKTIFLRYTVGLPVIPCIVNQSLFEVTEICVLQYLVTNIFEAVKMKEFVYLFIVTCFAHLVNSGK
jgi:hypothetical protein